MSDPRISAIICAAVAAWLGYQLFFSSEAPSTFLLALQWTFFLIAIVGAVAAIIRIARNTSR
jgi:membrane protein DedA with SNARE-associated domain